MAERINNFMKDSAIIRTTLYFFIAAIPAFITDLSQYKSFSDISSITIVVIVSNSILQGLIAVRAFIDQSLSRNTDKKNKKVELING